MWMVIWFKGAPIFTAVCACWVFPLSSVFAISVHVVYTPFAIWAISGWSGVLPRAHQLVRHPATRRKKADYRHFLDVHATMCMVGQSDFDCWQKPSYTCQLLHLLELTPWRNIHLGCGIVYAWQSLPWMFAMRHASKRNYKPLQQVSL